ncbi:IclR family transcriptional regulator [Neorhizobium sp. P12A]|jgi:DNA-binding IclR family transcriptional regulator|uniref:IclR family transcriptional regulator n=1 Tax=Rhizobium/Agrobacterium group TaxID=227290 RepID=UPI00104B9F4D|nr:MULTISPECIES: IclR family transcriptional regulator [Rhizobium/Agrobacterium group]KAA0700643.1 IclR family transcriptional regulator [Neorhizobium sp. P12A]TCR91960.1 IclR family transcriptional regulator [Rhizobium sp. BK376]
MADGAEDIVSRRTRGLDRAFEILEFLRTKRQPMRPNEIAVEIGAPRSSVYELINLLLRHGMLDYQGGDGRVFLGRKLYFFGTAYADQFDLMRESEAMLARLAEETRETAQMCLLEGNKYTVAMMREGIRAFRISSNVGELVPIPWTASGRLLVSHLTDEEILDLIPTDDFLLPSGKRLDPEKFIAEVRQATSDGYFTFNSEVETFTHCFAVPVHQADGQCVATLCLVAPKEDGLRNRQAYLKSLLAAAHELSEQLGYATGRKRAEK